MNMQIYISRYICSVHFGAAEYYKIHEKPKQVSINSSQKNMQNSNFVDFFMLSIQYEHKKVHKINISQRVFFVIKINLSRQTYIIENNLC